MKRLALFLIALFSLPAMAQNAALSGWCVQGATSAVVSGLQSTNKLQGIIPSCTITVFISGTSALATLYSNAGGTALSNPFTASGTGRWQFYAAGNAGYDVVASGGISPNTYPAPVTLAPDASPSAVGSFLPLAGGTLFGALIAPDINGEKYPAQCQSATPAPWCAGSTAADYISAACGQLPANGGFINLRGLTGNINHQVACTSPTKQVVFIQDPTSLLTITETDGLITIPLDAYSMFIGPVGAGQCPIGGGLHLTQTANVQAIIGPAHVDGTQEAFTVHGACLWGSTGGHAGATTNGMVYAKRVFVNTTITENNIRVCPTACLWLENVGGQVEVGNNEFSGTDGVYTINTSPINIVSSGGSGCGATAINIHGGNAEHANGGANYPEINIHGNDAGSVGCAIYVHDIYTEKNIQGTPSTIGIRIRDCLSCTVANVTGGGGNSTSGDLLNISQSAINRVQGINVSQLGNLFNSWTNTINDTTPLGSVLPLSENPIVSSYISNPGYQQPPVLPQSTIEALGADAMGGQGSLATGDGTLGTGFVAYGCVPASGVTCIYTRSNSTAPPGLVYSQKVQITVNTDAQGGNNGIEYSTPVSFVAGKSYQVTFWGKSDGSFTGVPEFVLGDPNIPTYYCQFLNSGPMTSTWQIFSSICTPTTSGTSYLAFSTLATPIFATGTFYLAGMTFAPVNPLPSNVALQAVGPYGVGPTIALPAGTPLPTCNTAARGNQYIVQDATSPTYLGTYANGGAITASVLCNGTSWVTH
jgi:hypothetical protein